MGMIQKGLGMLSGTLLLTLVGALQSVVVARTLGPEGTGQFQLAVSVSVVGSTLVILGVGQANIYFLNHHREPLSVLLLNSLALSTVLGAVASLGVYLALWFGNGLAGRLDHWIVVVFSLSAALMTLQLMLRPMLVAQYKVMAYNACLLLGRSSVLAGILILFWWGRLSPGLALLFLAASQVLIVGAILVSFHHQIDYGSGLKFRVMGKTLRYGLKLHAVNLLSTIDQNIGILSIGVLMAGNFAAAGYFSRAVAICLLLRIIPLSISNLLYSHWAAVSERQRVGQMEKVLRLITVTGALLCLVLLSCAGPIVTMLYGRNFYPAAEVLRVLAVQQFFWMLSQIFQSFFMGSGRPRLTAINLSLCTLVSLGMMATLIPRLGAMGAALALAVGHAGCLGANFYIAHREYRISVLRSLYISRSDLVELLSLFFQKRQMNS
jgi:O-antigen/teichoic acid export membrane protein